MLSVRPSPSRHCLLPFACFLLISSTRHLLIYDVVLLFVWNVGFKSKDVPPVAIVFPARKTASGTIVDIQENVVE